MEEYNRDSLRALRREAAAKPAKRQGNRWLTLIIILLFLLAGSLFAASKFGFDPKDAKNIASRWSGSIKDSFKKEKNDITETVDAVLADQNETI